MSAKPVTIVGQTSVINVFYSVSTADADFQLNISVFKLYMC